MGQLNQLEEFPLVAGTGELPPSNQLESLWDVPTENISVSTGRVNAARRYLHSSADLNSSQSSDDSSLVKGRASFEVEPMWTGAETGALDEDKEFVTPPSSPGASSVTSMETCQEGDRVFLQGLRPTQLDRRLLEATNSLQLNQLEEFPLVAGYLASLRAVSPSDRKKWPLQPEEIGS